MALSKEQYNSDERTHVWYGVDTALDTETQHVRQYWMRSQMRQG